MHVRQAKALLAQARLHFRALLADRKAPEVCASFIGRIAVTLSGGGARGAYEAGVLQAFQDAALPTHILSAASVGSINAASYAAHSKTVVGNAESLVESWFSLTPSAVGIEWTRFALMLAGFLAAGTGFGSLWWMWMEKQGFVFIHLHDPKLTWLFLGLAGTAVLFLYNHIPYIGRGLGSLLRGERWRPQGKTLALSLVANVLVWSFVVVVISPAHLHISLIQALRDYPKSTGVTLAAVLALLMLIRRFRDQTSLLFHRILRVPFRTGLFPNFERIRFLQECIPIEGLQASPMRVVMTATEMQSGNERFFCNASRTPLLADPGVNAAFATNEIEPQEDLMRVLIASSALPIVYEAVSIGRRLFADGGIVMNQPIRPAIKLGADVLFLVTPGAQRQKGSDLRTFLDLGLRSIEIMMGQNMRRDLKIFRNINQLCEKHAAELGVRPEQLVIEIGQQRYRYLKSFYVCPAEPLLLTRLDFDSCAVGPAILQGYADGCQAFLDFLAYALEAPAALPKEVVVLSPKAVPA